MNKPGKITVIFLLVAIFMVMFNPGSIAASLATVTVPDMNLANAICLMLGKPFTNVFTLAEMQRLDYLDASGRDVVNLAGLQYAVNLKELDLSYNKIENLQQLTGLGNLQWLYLSYNKISDISPLAALTGIKELDLAANNITDIASLGGMLGLEQLNISMNTISNIGALSGLTVLKELNISHNQVSDINTLAGLVNLQQLYLSANSISTISVLANMSGLERLNISHNQVSDISALSGLTKLQQLGLSANKITSLVPLAGLISLKELDLSDNTITDTGPLAGLTGLELLNMANNNIGDNIKALENLVSLKTLDLSANEISNLFSMRWEGLLLLRELYLPHNQIPDFWPIAMLSKLQTLNLSSNQIQDLEPLNTMLGLHKLDLSNNGIRDLTISEEAGAAWANLRLLRTLNLSDNKLISAAELAGLRLAVLDLSENELDEINVLANIEILSEGPLGGGVLRLSGNKKIHDLSPLAGKTLRVLDLSGNTIVDIRPLAEVRFSGGLLGGSWLELSDNLISDIAPLALLPAIDVIYLEYNYLDTREGSQAISAINSLIRRLGTKIFYTPQKDMGIIYGEVHNFFGEPLQGVNISAQFVNNRFETTTNSLGEYELMLPAVALDIKFVRHGYRDRIERLTVRSGQRHPLSIQMEKLPIWGEIAGKVTDAGDGSPVEAVTVMVRDTGGNTYSLLTDDEGFYSFDVPEGNYEAEFRLYGYHTVRKNVTVARNIVTVLDVSLTKQYAWRRIEGRVTDIYHAPMAGAQVIAVRLNNDVYRAYVGADGTYSLPVPIGNYNIEFRQSGYTSQHRKLRVREGPVYIIGTVRLTPLQNVGKIRGIVVNQAGDPLRNVQVIAVSDSEAIETLTNRHGSFELILPQGTYRVQFIRDGYIPLVRENVTVTKEAETNLGTVQKQIVDHSGSIIGIVNDPDEMPVEDVMIIARDIATNNSFETRTGLYGFFGLNVPEGTYNIEFRRTGYVTVIRKSVSVKQKETVDAGFIIMESLGNDGIISGKVTNAKGEPLAGVQVNVGGVGVTTTTAEGTYRLRVVEGIYNITFRKSGFVTAQRNATNIPRWQELNINIQLGMYGDIDNNTSINIIDAVLVLQHIVNLINLQTDPRFASGAYARALVYAGDRGGEDGIGIRDAIVIIRYIVGKPVVFPS